MLNWCWLKKIQYCYGWWCCCCPPMNAACVKFLTYLPRFIVSCIRSFSWRTTSRRKKEKKRKIGEKKKYERNIEFNWFVYILIDHFVWMENWNMFSAIKHSRTTKTKFSCLCVFCSSYFFRNATFSDEANIKAEAKKEKGRHIESAARKKKKGRTNSFSVVLYCIVSFIDIWN